MSSPRAEHSAVVHIPEAPPLDLEAELEDAIPDEEDEYGEIDLKVDADELEAEEQAEVRYKTEVADATCLMCKVCHGVDLDPTAPENDVETTVEVFFGKCRLDFILHLALGNMFEWEDLLIVTISCMLRSHDFCVFSRLLSNNAASRCKDKDPSEACGLIVLVTNCWHC